MKHLLATIKSKIIAIGVMKFTIIASVSVLALAVATTAAVLLIEKPESNEDTQATQAISKDTQKAEAVTKNSIEVPQYTQCALSADSIEKDLTIYITDAANADSKIAGTTFAFKLVSNEEAAKLSDTKAKMEAVDAKLAKAVELNLSEIPATEEKLAQLEVNENTTEASVTGTEEQKSAGASEIGPDDQKSMETPVTETSTTEAVRVNEATNQPLTVRESLLLQKKEAIASYGKVLETLTGETYTDEDQDGMIHAESLNPGDYTLCMVPCEAYDTASYAIAVNVKDKIEYKPVKEIKKKINKNASDVKPAAKTVDAVMKDTVEFVASSQKEIYEQVTVAGYTASVGSMKDELLTIEDTSHAGNDSTQSAGGTATIKIPSAINLYASAYADGNQIEFTVVAEGCEVTGVRCNESGIQVSFQNGRVKIVTNVNTTACNKANLIYETNIGEKAVSCLTVTGSNEKVKTPDGKAVYTDANHNNQMTVGAFNGSGYVNTSTIYYGWQKFNDTSYFYDKNGNKVTGEQVINGIKYHFGSDGALLKGGTGIDVSKWNGTINWKEVKSNVSFVIIRCGYRSRAGQLNSDPKYAANIQGAKAQGLQVGLYFYSTAQTEAEAVEEASLAIALANEQGGCSLPIYYDIEDDSRQGSLTKAQRTALCNAFCNTIRAAGYRPGVYASYSWLTNKIDTGSLSGISIWCARYNTYCGLKYHYDIWQYTDKGSCPGINGNVDMNEAYF